MRKFFPTLTVLACLIVGTAVADVTVAVPTNLNNQSLPSPLAVSASARSSHQITGWWIYVDNKGFWHSSQDVSSITAKLSLPSGWHNIHVRAWDSTGAFGDAYFNVKIVTESLSSVSSSISTSALPLPPSTAKVFSNLEESTSNWDMCTSPCAGGRVSYSFYTSPAAWPAMDGMSREFFNGGGAYSNVLYIRKGFGQQNFAHNFLWDYYMYLDEQTASGIYALEQDLWLSQNHVEYMAGTQAHYPDGTGNPGHWDTWNQRDRHWVHNTDKIAPRFTGNTWHHMQWYMQRDETNLTYTYKTLVIDGGTDHQIVINFNQTQPASAIDWADSFGVQWQLDLNKYGTDAREFVDKVKVTLW